ncbi:MAG: carotenoid 1,2-hydratase [Dechloromonas sp.]|nr:carotenoid 1,2-hydratase [Dechloromonas sp.]
MIVSRRAFLMTLGSLPAWRAGELLAGTPVEFAVVRPGQALEFPRDHGAHPDFRNEWWYSTGWLSLPDGSPLGFQCTFFRVRTGLGEHNPSAFAPRQLVLAHAAIADSQLGRLCYAQRTARTGFGRAGFASGRTEVWIDDWRFEQRFDQDGERYRLAVRAADFAYALTLVAAAQPLLHGDAGFSRKAPDPRHASYYYSRPQLAVSGTVTRDGRAQLVSGRAWLDHEWSSQLLPEGAQGWDWLGLNLDDGGALMVFRLRRPDGSPLWAAATLQPAGQVAQVLPPAAVAFEPLRHWRSPRSAIAYPVEWRVRIGRRSFEIRPLLDDQELDSRRSTGAIYWEGAVRVAEEGREVGRGYLEMTGYGERIKV